MLAGVSLGRFDPPGKEVSKPDTHPNVSVPGTGGPSGQGAGPGIKTKLSYVDVYGARGRIGRSGGTGLDHRTRCRPFLLVFGCFLEPRKCGRVLSCYLKNTISYF